MEEAEEDPDLKELADEIQSEIQAAVQSVIRPTRKNCGSCHFKGGGGEDEFVFDGKPGNDIVADFKPNVDYLRFERDTGIRNFDDFLARAEDTADGAVVTLDADTTVLLEDVSLSQLDKDDLLLL